MAARTKALAVAVTLATLIAGTALVHSRVSKARHDGSTDDSSIAPTLSPSVAATPTSTHDVPHSAQSIDASEQAQPRRLEFGKARPTDPPETVKGRAVFAEVFENFRKDGGLDDLQFYAIIGAIYDLQEEYRVLTHDISMDQVKGGPPEPPENSDSKIEQMRREVDEVAEKVLNPEQLALYKNRISDLVPLLIMTQFVSSN